jgi:hypothetical protein
VLHVSVTQGHLQATYPVTPILIIKMMYFKSTIDKVHSALDNFETVIILE